MQFACISGAVMVLNEKHNEQSQQKWSSRVKRERMNLSASVEDVEMESFSDGSAEAASTTSSAAALTDISNLSSQPGRLVPLKTKAETRAGVEVLQVWIVEVPAKSAENILKCV